MVNEDKQPAAAEQPTEFEEPSFDPDVMEPPLPPPVVVPPPVEEPPAAPAKPKAPKAPKKPKSVYVSGLPEDISDYDFGEYFSKCGIIDKDAETAEKKCKVYRDEEGRCKGDGVVHYFKPESVQLAIQLLDGSQITPGHTIAVQEAKYEKKRVKGQKKPKQISKKIKRYDASKELSWEEDDNCHVIMKHMFTQEEAWATPDFFDVLKEEVVAECEKFGTVKNIKVFERNPEGVVAVKFLLHPAAQRCIEKMNGRFFGGSRLEAFFYDGFADYEVKETEEQKEKRIEEWNKWLEDQEEEEKNQKK
ncbi:HIV Tat-specific factor [Planoprotostelium fungivorum]|uniref:HIV Tat-specific factor n=1 Tax=Planoprotostelium fungivorum TaxID=1890364 RepID=A0A2P6NNC0_9EUKA|nr:HIV Tat-specific factor [Planoprotostelium fungivorum]